jgi:alkanesulfonate monooxygenase SsuD/methylene tetrahydromethanopterin reductase-like flavin-dependent oxidoreductase (luciferase family)
MHRISLALPGRGLGTSARVEQALAIAELADLEPGWDGLWIGDSLAALPVIESMMLLSACAARTSRIRLGVSCQASLGLREPVLLAAQWSAADVISGGRVVLVACPGWGTGEAVERELRAFGLDHAEKVRRMEARIAELRGASEHGRIEAGGEQLELATPFVQRRLPIWLAANPREGAAEAVVERVLERVARLGDGWMTYAVSPQTLHRRIELLARLRDGAGRPGVTGFPVCVSVNVNVDLDGGRARRAAADAWRLQGTRNVAADELDRISAIGTPERVAERLDELLDAGATELCCYLLSDQPLAQVELLTRRVLPALARRTAAEPVGA